jgi:hypothetical protein
MKKKLLGIASHSVLLVTVVLFVIAVFEKGFTHDLLLETAVFLVSVKLVLGLEHSEESNREIVARLDAIEKKLGR